MNRLKSTYRTHTCGTLSTEEVGTVVTLSGWIHRRRDHGGVVFIDLRDHYGITQIVFPGELSGADAGLSEIHKTRIESVIQVKGKVSRRSDELVNPKIATGEIEVQAESFSVLSEAKVLPFLINEDDNAPEVIRLKHRFLELRRELLHKNIALRSDVTRAIREIMHDLGFTEYTTPILTSSSPEGARDFIVPSRLHPGKFFALPQAPQQFKQLLMVAGFDRYFQIAPCFRDEDARADRSPGEFYQIDIELSFVEQEDIIKFNEEFLMRLFSEFSNWKIPEHPFPRIPYNEALATYGSDKPDLRNPLRIRDVSNVFQDTNFRVFRSVLDDGGSIRAIKVPVGAVPPRKYFDDLIAETTKKTGKGLAYLICEGSETRGSIAKFFEESEIAALRSELSVGGTELVFFMAGPTAEILPPLGRLLGEFAEKFDLIEKETWRFCWVTEYPLYERDPKTGKIEFSHNPFSMPQGGLEALTTKDPLEVYATQYDIVLNGNELASGAIRNHLPEVMYKAFEIAGYGKEVVDEKFGGMIRAFQYGAPPHGGCAYGLERIVMLLAGQDAIREVIPFPLAQTGEDLLMGAPSEVSDLQLKEVHIQRDLPVEADEVA